MDDWEDVGEAELVDPDTDTEDENCAPNRAVKGRARRHKITRVRQFVYPDGRPTEDFDPEDIRFSDQPPAGWFDE